MRKITLVMYGIALVLSFVGCGKPAEAIPQTQLDSLLAPVFAAHADTTSASTVFFTRNLSSDGVLKVFDKIASHVDGKKIGVKVHFGEAGNKNYIGAEFSQKLCEKLSADWIETNVVYPGPRSSTSSHVKLARDHGFVARPINILDEKGEVLVSSSHKHFKKVRVAAGAFDYDDIIIFSHFKGHGSAGFGGAIKNVSMGLATPKGKGDMHKSKIPNYFPDKCVKCKQCIAKCAGNAITIDPLVIDPDKCVGCGMCISICPSGAIVNASSDVADGVFLERLAEYAEVIADTLDLVYINVVAKISKSCDCNPFAAAPFVSDIGIFASTDAVAIDRASLDFVNAVHKCDDAFLKESNISGNQQLVYGEQIGLGRNKYFIIDCDK